MKAYGSSDLIGLLQLPMVVAPGLKKLMASVHAPQGGFLRLPGLPQLAAAHLTFIDATGREAPVLTLTADSFGCQVMHDPFGG